MKTKTYEVTLEEVHKVIWKVDAESSYEAEGYALDGDGELLEDNYSHTLEKIKVKKH